MKAAITGATGLLGANLAIELLAQGHEVVATKRSSSRTAHLDEFDIEWIEASLGDEESLIRAFFGADVVFHCAAAVSIQKEVTPWIVDANIHGTRNVIIGVNTVGARLVHCSTVGAVGLSTDGQPCTEESTWNMREFGLDDAYVVTKRDAELDVMREAGQGKLDAVVVNPTYMIGPYDSKPSSGTLVRDLVAGKVPGYTTGVNNFVDVRDVSRGMVRAATHGATGERYILGGHNMTYKEFMFAVADITGSKRPRLKVPDWLGNVLGHAGELHGALRDGEPVLNRATMAWSQTDRYHFSSAKAERELDYQISPLEPAIADCVAWFRERGML